MNFTITKFGDFAVFKYGKMPKKSEIKENGRYPIYSGYRYVGYYDDYNTETNQLIIVARGVGGTGDVKLTNERCYLTNLSISAQLDENVALPQYLYYYFSLRNLRYLDSGSAQSQITISDLQKVEIPLPNIENQIKLVNCLGVLDYKIRTNEVINNNLEQQAQAIFDAIFPNISNGENSIGDTITPKRGKGLLSKNAVFGNVPVVAGGLEPSTYHNVANTVAPVLAISASGANSGYVSLWNIPIWSSDSSYIDSSMTDDVYFWYVLLKKRQKEIYDAQTGSAQPHIYPQHIAAMPISTLNFDDVYNYTVTVTPIFEMIGHNKDENVRLVTTRDTLLPKLMSGEFDISDIDI